MNERLIELAVFLAGAGSGALLKYLQDRRLLRWYGDLVRNLSRALQQQSARMGKLPEVNGASQGKLLTMEKAGTTSLQ